MLWWEEPIVCVLTVVSWPFIWLAVGVFDLVTSPLAEMLFRNLRDRRR